MTKYYVHDCLKNFLLLFMPFITAQIVKNSHYLTGIYLIFLKNILDQTWETFNTKSRPQWIDRKCSYQERPILTLFCDLFSYFLLKLWLVNNWGSVLVHFCPHWVGYFYILTPPPWSSLSSILRFYTSNCSSISQTELKHFGLNYIKCYIFLNIYEYISWYKGTKIHI